MYGGKTNTFGLTGNQLKMIAMLLMTVDHIGAYLLTQYSVLRIIGRLAMPVFAFMIAEGCRYTKNRLRYLLTIATFALVCQVVYWVFQHSLIQCILVTFSLSVLLIYVLEYACREKSVLSVILAIITLAAVCWICNGLPDILPGFRIDYGLFGVLLPVAVYFGKTRPQQLAFAAADLALLAMGPYSHQWYALLSLPLLALYNGKRGKGKLKYFFYFYYPLHLAAIYGIGLLLS